MNKSVLIAIQPYYVFLIIAHLMGWNIPENKTVEVRKNFPQDIAWDRVAHIYCSKNKKSFNRIPKQYQPFMGKLLGKVVGEFVCDNIEQIIPDYNPVLGKFFYSYVVDLSSTCLIEEELHKYAGIEPLYFWHIFALKIYDTPKELREFNKVCSSAPDAKCYPENCERCPWNAITRPPQNWFYVEG